VTCTRAELVQRFVDDELADTERDQMAAHLAGCSECTARVADGLALKRAVRIAAQRDMAPPDLHAAVRRQLNPKGATLRNWQWAATAAALILAVLAGGSFFLRRSGDPLVAELVDQHVVALSSANPVDVISEDRHTVKPWFQGRLPFTFNLPELTGTNLQLLGGKVTYLQQRPAAQLLYQAGRHKISVFVAQDGSGAIRAGSTAAFNVHHWSAQGLQFYVVSDASDAETSQLLGLLQSVNQSPPVR
jgi:anti-sigma factor RsiW